MKEVHLTALTMFLGAQPWLLQELSIMDNLRPQ